MKAAALLPLLLALVSAISLSDGHFQWEILTNRNFSQIRLYPHALLFVTVPWCGESRSLMKELTQLVTNRHEEFGYLKLIVLYRNSEKTLAQAIGAGEGRTLFYYHHGVPYNYQGKLRAWNILFSIHPHLSASHELPLKHLESQNDLETFLESTDKALLLLEFCGWTPRLLSKLKNNITKDNSKTHGDFSKEVETDRMLLLRGKDKPEGHANGNMMCGVRSGFGGIPWLQDFCFINETSAFPETDGINLGFGQTCTIEDYRQFRSFFSKLIAIAKELSLPPQRHRFGLVTDRSLAFSLGVGESNTWLAVLQSAGCPHCSKTLKAGDDIRRYLKMKNPIVAELEVDWEDLEPSLPSSKPSVILFVDRSCDSSEDRRRSKKVLTIFREVAAQYQVPNVINWENIQTEKSVSQAGQELGTSSGLSRLKITQELKKIKLENKVSLMILDGDKTVAVDNIGSDLEGSSLHEILTNLLHGKRENKLSLIAKDVGFHLLSDDMDIKIIDTMSTEPEVPPGLVSSPPSLEATGGSIISSNEFRTQNKVDMPSLEEGEMKSSEVNSFSADGEEENVFANKSEQSVTVDADKLEASVTKHVKAEVRTSSWSDSREVYSFKGQFFFSDANCRLLRALTGESKIPSAVIIDPALQQHYVFHNEVAFSYSSLADFLQGYLNGSLLPYKRSESITQIPRKATSPPFVNLDFHEVDPIPQVTVNTFSQLVRVLNQSASESASYSWNEDVLILFSNRWCGFCQRMELVVRELYRALKQYRRTTKGGSGNNQVLVGTAETSTSGANVKPPLIYLMDCTLNDCSLMLKSMNQREVYPALTLFPAEREEAILYDGDTTVAGIINFLALHGNNLCEFLSMTGILSTVAEKERRSSNAYGPSATIAGEIPGSDKPFEVVLRNRVPTPKRAAQHIRVKPLSPTHSGEPTPDVKAGTILVATEKLINSQPFDKSRILMVNAGPETGFQGLIINKLLRWESFPELGEWAELLKEAPLSYGGPVVDPGMPFLALSRNNTAENQPEVVPGVCFLDQAAVMGQMEELRSGNKSLSNYWLFLGYSRWSYNQLFDEIAIGAWTIDNGENGFAWP